MDSKLSYYLKTDNNTFINEQNIVWVRQMKDCLRVATMETGSLFNTYNICKLNSPYSYDKLYDKIKHIGANATIQGVTVATYPSGTVDESPLPRLPEESQQQPPPQWKHWQQPCDSTGRVETVSW